MDIRNIQKTGDMFYMYLPTRWCKKFNISAQSKVGVQISADGSLLIHPQASKQKPIHLKLSIKGSNMEIMQKLIIAAYLSPADSFKIELEKEIDFTKILDQKNLISLELVEIDGNHISCESTINVSDPFSLLLTMIKKVKNMLRVLEKGTHKELIERYEEEIDRSRLLIEKSVISSLINSSQTSYKATELHFISMLAKHLETVVDHLTSLKPTKNFTVKISDVINVLLQLLEDKTAKLNYHECLPFLMVVDKLPNISVKDVDSYDRRRIIRGLNNISEIMIDWAIIKETELV